VSDTFPRQYARTQRLTLGEPRNLTVTPDGDKVLFLRSNGGSDPVNRLWIADVATARETLLADPEELRTDASADLSADERARRERLREGAGGITAYSISRNAERIAFGLGGELFVADTTAGSARRVDVDGPVFDPRPSPSGDLVAYVHGAELRVTDLDGDGRTIAAEPDPIATVTWGSPEFIAAEEMRRFRGYWWSPDGTAIAVCRVDTAPVRIWHIADPADPGIRPLANRYPAAGTANADVSLHVVGVDGGQRVRVDWDRQRFPYLTAVNWNDHGLTVTVQSRDQRDVEVRHVDPSGGATTLIWSDHDDVWVELVPGTGALVGPDTTVMCADRGGARRLLIGDEIVSPADVQVRSVIAATSERVVVSGNPSDDATVLHVYEWTAGGFSAITDGFAVNVAAVGGDTTVVRTMVVDEPGGRWRLPSGDALDSHAERPLVRPNVAITTHSERTAATAVLLPHDHDGSPLPVLLDPYAGPHAQRVLRTHDTYCASQWFADQGFAVVIIDGRGTPGRGSTFERSVRDDLAVGVLDDQVTGLHAAAERHPELDLGRVAIRGWSFGGYLAALAVLRRPDVFHAAVAGAPVTEWRLYDTHYSERYLGDPNDRPDVYDGSSLLPLADRLTRPLLLIHGLADDNVVAAHTLQLSSALLTSGKPHEVLPLVGVTHMTPQETVAENLLLHQLDFLRRSLPDGPAN